MNKQTRNGLIDNREHFEGCQMRGGFGGRVKKVKGLRGTNWRLQNCHGDVKHSTGNIVDNSLITEWCQMGVRFIRMIAQ